MQTFEPNDYIISRLDRLEERLLETNQSLNSIDKTLVRNTESLEEHKRRSEANEKAVAILKDELRPVITHVALMQALGKITLVLVTSGAVLRLITYLVSGR